MEGIGEEERNGRGDSSVPMCLGATPTEQNTQIREDAEGKQGTDLSESGLIQDRMVIRRTTGRDSNRPRIQSDPQL